MPQCAVLQPLVIQLDFVYHVCVCECVWAVLLFITSIRGVGKVGAQLEQKHSTLITQLGKNNQKNRCFFPLTFDQSCVAYSVNKIITRKVSLCGIGTMCGICLPCN